MTFVSLTYALFLGLLLLLYWNVNQERLRLMVLLGASVVFMATQQAGVQVAYIPLLLIATLINFQFGRLLDRKSNALVHDGDAQLSNEDWQYAEADWTQRRMSYLVAGIMLNVAVLLSFKYVPFFLMTAGETLGKPELLNAAETVKRSLLVPLGISYFTFESIAYLVDVYRGAPASQSLLRFTTYKLFFPKLISGPITRYHAMSSQLRKRLPLDVDQVSEGLWLIARGAIKKAVFADRLGILAQLSFTNVQRAGSIDIWMMALAYGLQLYLDFSGFIDMARGAAKLLGLNLPENFNAPYFTTSIAEFWRRWHMTLGDWLRNYLYFPLGGSRQGLVRTCINLMIIMLVAGFWHDATWGFIAWGAIHGVALVVHRLNDVAAKRSPQLQSWWSSVPGMVSAWAITQTVVFLSWLFFALPSVNQAWWAVSHLFGQAADAQFVQKVYLDVTGLDRTQVLVSLCLIFGGMGLLYAWDRALKVRFNWPVKLALVPMLLYVVWQLTPEGGLPYIYFNF